MGILAEPLAWLKRLPLPAGYSMCEFGDQWITCQNPPVLAKQFFLQNGCGHFTSIDGNGRGTLTADLNNPLPDHLVGQFHVVTDFGTGEHVFNQHQVWKSLHDLVQHMGFIVFDRPSKGYDGHCFFLTQENFYLALVHANRYTVHQFERYTSSRGELIRGVFQKRFKKPFIVPQQGRYYKDLVIDAGFKARGADYKSGLKEHMGMRK